jgi:hypothetical protein
MEGLMTAEVKDFPTRKRTPAESMTPEQHELWVKHDRIDGELKAIARRVRLLSFAITGLMTLHDNDEVEGLCDAADEIYGELIVLTEELA